MKKALLVTHVSGFVPQFEMNNVRLLQNIGYEIHYATNYNNPSYGTDNKRLYGTGIICHQIDFVRSPYSIKNFRAYNQLKRLMSIEKFDLIHCHNPMSGVLTRLAGHATKTEPLFYTAHGFHFFQGAALWNWVTYYPIEYILSYYTDQQICINKEDYELAKKNFHAKQVNYIPGVGVDIEKISNIKINKAKKRKELGVPEHAKLILSVGELIKRKNHETALRAIAKMKDNSYIYMICGHGELESYLRKLAYKLGIDKKVFFLGYRTDILEIYKASDVFLFPSFQEGLPVALLEAMACGLPVICSNIRGNRDLIDERGGILVGARKTELYTVALENLFKDENKFKLMGKHNLGVAQQYNDYKVSDDMKKLYEMWDAENKLLLRHCNIPPN